METLSRSAGRAREQSRAQLTEDPGNATPWAWRSALGEGDPNPLPEEFFLDDAACVARKLLGCILRTEVEGVVSEGVIIETEAYIGPQDPASHAAARIGPTQRNRTMFGPPGHAYVYRSYGIHWCLNVVTGETGFPAAVLLRAAEPLVGMEGMTRRRRKREPLAAGPGRLTEAFGVTGELDGHLLSRPPAMLLGGWSVPGESVAVSGRVGVRNAADWPQRYYLRGHPGVSRGPHQRLS